MRILLADDEQSIAVTLGDALTDAGHAVTVVGDGLEANERLQKEPFDLLVTDIRMPGMDGMALLKSARALSAPPEVVVITGHGTIPTAVEAIRYGAYDYVLKPFLNEDILRRVQKLEEFRQLKSENLSLRSRLGQVTLKTKIVGESEAMRRVMDLLRTIADSDEDVLIQGETGTGKELIAKMIHELSPRSDGPFIVLSCSAFPATLLEDEIFGHEKGAFTDARTMKQGRFERAQKGTLFLDDVDDVPIETQVKLLRVLQERNLERLGGERTIDLDVRVVTATKIDLRTAVEDGDFREDLFHRINLIPVELPPLRERPSDIPILLRHFIALYGKGKSYEVDDATMSQLMAYDWRGNVRELENATRRAVAMSGSDPVLKREHLLVAAPKVRREGERDEGPVERHLRAVVREAEARHIRRVLDHTGYHRANTAKILGISRKNLWEKMREYEISERDG